MTQKTLFGREICTLTLKGLASEITREPSTNGVRLVATMNLDHVANLRRNAAFRLAYSSAWAVTIDGAPVFAYARVRGVEAPGRITGVDLFAELARSWSLDRRPFFITSTPETGERLIESFLARGFPKEALAFDSPAFGFEKNQVQSAALCATIRAHGTTDLVFGVGSPKSEIWIDTHRGQLGDLYAYGFGAGLDFLIGHATRAPTVLRRLGLEWLWRLGLEPTRLWRRYLVDSWAALPSVAADLVGRAPHGKPCLND